MKDLDYRRGLGVRRASRRRVLGGLGLALAGTAAEGLLAACGRSGQAGSGTSRSAASGTPKAGGILTTSLNVDPSDFDPTGRPTVNRTVLCYVYDSLLSFTYGPNVPFNQVQVQPGLADSWESPDGSSFTFHLHKGARFANQPLLSGRAVTADDVQWSIQYVSRTGPIADNKKLFPGQYADSFVGMTDVQTPDPYTVVVRFAKPFAPYVNYAAAEWNPILAHEVYDQDGNFSSHTAGTGPFQLDMASSQKANRYVYKKNPTYYRSGLPYVNQLTELIIPDDSTSLAAFQTNQLDILPTWASVSVGGPDAIKRAVPNAVVLRDLQKSFVLLTNLSQPPLNDPRVRQALSLSIDRDELVRVMTAGRGEWALAGAVPGYFTPQEVKELVKYDPEQAKQLLAAAGYSDGVELEMIDPTTKYGQQLVTELQLIQSQVKKAGITLKLKPVTDIEDSQNKRKGTFQLDLDPNTTKAGDPDGSLYPLYYSASVTTNYLRVKDPKLDALLDAQRQEMDAAKRKDLVRQALRLINDNTYGIGMYDYPEYRGVHPYVKNFAPNFAQFQDHQTQTWLDK